MRATMLLVLAVCLTAAMAPMAQERTREGGTQAQTEDVRAEVPLEIPRAEKMRTNPIPRTDDNVEFGAQIYASQCAMCHGKAGKGDGDLAKSLKMTMPDFSDPEVQKSRTDGELFYILTKGHGRMPADGERLSEDYRWKMVLAIRAMGR